MKCKYYDEFTGICCNGDCHAYCADDCIYEFQKECIYFQSDDGRKEKSYMEKDLISRKYAINQIDIAIIDIAISKEESKEERERLSLIKEFLLALPSVHELDRHVYCTNCEYLRINEEEINCKYESICAQISRLV